MLEKEIIFTSPVAGLIEEPKPALQFIPEEYKKLKKDLENGGRTVKSCMPFLDSLTMGYILTTPVEIGIVLKRIENRIEFYSSINKIIPEELHKFLGVSSHGDAQVPPKLRSQYRSLDVVLKFQTPWQIKTPKGYSCLFTNPFNKNMPFEIVDGVVDTDEFDFPVHFPFYWTGEIKDEIIIPKGTPIVQIIPFARENWKMKINQGEIETKKSRIKFGNFIRDGYKKLFWKKKSYK
jgi:hypothetical protein